MIVPSAAQSPPHADAVYPVRLLSDAVWTSLAVTLVATPLVTELPSMNSGKSDTTLFPPLSLTTVLTIVSFGEMSSFVIVHVADSPMSSVIVSESF